MRNVMLVTKPGGLDEPRKDVTRLQEKMIY